MSGQFGSCSHSVLGATSPSRVKALSDMLQLQQLRQMLCKGDTQPAPLAGDTGAVWRPLSLSAVVREMRSLSSSVRRLSRLGEESLPCGKSKPAEMAGTNVSTLELASQQTTAFLIPLQGISAHWTYPITVENVALWTHSQ